MRCGPAAGCRPRSAWPNPTRCWVTPTVLGTVDLFGATLRQTAPRLGYLIPDFQNPTGALMDTGTRETLVAAARDSPHPAAGRRIVPGRAFPGFGAAAAADGRLRRRDPGAVDRVGVQVHSGAACGSAGSGPRRPWCSGWPPPGHSATCPARCWTSWWSPHMLADAEPALTVQRSRLATGAAALQAALAAELPDWRPTQPAGGTFAVGAVARTVRHRPRTAGPVGRACGSRPDRGSGRTAPWSRTCGCRSPPVSTG